MTTPTKIQAKFNPGRMAATPAFMAKVTPDWAVVALAMHLNANWGLVDAEDWAANDAALKTGGRILSSYAMPDDASEFWILTEADRSVTTFLLPSDY